MQVDLKPIGEAVGFASRSGVIVGYTTFARREVGDKIYQTYYVVELDHISQDWLGDKRDCFISCMIVHPDSVDRIKA